MLKLFWFGIISLGVVVARLDLTPPNPDEENENSGALADEPGPGTPFECNSTETSFHSDPKDCHSYYICFNGTATHHTCPMDMAYHCDMNLCISDLYTPGCRPPVECVKNGYIADPKDCTKFYQCSYGHPYHMECPEGTRFDPVSARCTASVPCLVRSKYVLKSKLSKLVAKNPFSG